MKWLKYKNQIKVLIPRINIQDSTAPKCIANISKFFYLQAHLEKQLLDVTPISSLPEVPKTDLPKSKTKPKKVKEEDEMAELAAWAS